MSSTPDILEALRRLEANLYERLENKIDTKIDAFRLEMNGRFDAIEARLDRLETEYPSRAKLGGDFWEAP